MWEDCGCEEGNKTCPNILRNSRAIPLPILFEVAYRAPEKEKTEKC